MIDIKTVYIPETMRFDWEIVSGDIAADDDLETSVILSLFTDRRADSTDEIAPGEDPRGWWGDSFPEVAGDVQGSRLWLLTRAKDVPETYARAREYALEALRWMVEDGLARAVEVEVERVRAEVLGIGITITRSDGTPKSFRYAIRRS